MMSGYPYKTEMPKLMLLPQLWLQGEKMLA
jgi:hypothetical protein